MYGRIISEKNLFLLSSASTVGLAGIWRLPYLVAEYGVGFLYMYLVCAFFIGVPMVMSVLVLGRLCKSHSLVSWEMMCRRWPFLIHCDFLVYIYLLIIICLLGLYTVVTGWLLFYVVSSPVVDVTQAKLFFNHLIQDPYIMMVLNCTVVLVVLLVAQNKPSIKEITFVRYIHLLVLCLFLFFIVYFSYFHSSNAVFTHFFHASLNHLTIKMLVSVVGQLCFALGLGTGAYVMLGSTADRQASMLHAACRIVSFNTLFSVAAVLFVLPIAAYFGITKDAGMGLLFRSVHSAVGLVPLSHFMHFLFFILLFISATSRIRHSLEVLIDYFTCSYRQARLKTTVFLGAGVYLASMVMVLSMCGVSILQFNGRSLLHWLDHIIIDHLLFLLGFWGMLVLRFGMTCKEFHIGFHGSCIKNNNVLFDLWGLAPLAFLLCNIVVK